VGKSNSVMVGEIKIRTITPSREAKTWNLLLKEKHSLGNGRKRRGDNLDFGEQKANKERNIPRRAKNVFNYSLEGCNDVGYERTTRKTSRNGKTAITTVMLKSVMESDG